MVSFLLFTDFTTTPLYCSEQIKCTLISLTTHIAAFSTAWSLLDSPQNAQTEFYLFQKHLLQWGVHSDLQSLWTFLKHII